jgi:signal peptidase I
MRMSEPSEPTVATPAQHHETHVKDTVESILVAFILAFIFRGFVVEAFVIPTGSMAPTLYGAHMRLHCPDCGYTWDVGYRAARSADDTDIPHSTARSIPYHCPNCGYAIAESPHLENDFARQQDQPVRFGDRILVLKYIYLFEDPHRWDVVVFKSPSEDSRGRDSGDPEYSQNFIKRLIGLPGESVVILDGSIFTGSHDAELNPAPDGSVRGADQFTIRRRPPFVQDRLWRNVYDNDYLAQLDRTQDPSSQDVFRQPWKPSGVNDGWQTTDARGKPSRTFRFDNASAGDALSFDPDANPGTHALTDWLAYDEAEEDNQPWTPMPVSDLKLDCFYTRTAGDGALQLQLTKRDDAFTARITRGKLALLHGKIRRANPLQITDEKLVGGSELDVPELGDGKPVELEMTNVDYRVTVRVNGRVIIQSGDDEYHPDVTALFNEYERESIPPMPHVRITAERQTCLIEHLNLARNIYYLNDGGSVTFWASPRKIIHLGPKEYFVMGDNSFISGDARYWKAPVELPEEGLPYVEGGRVPGEFMLGKAFFVYWPAGFEPSRMIQMNIVPDFGEMRFIH